MNTKLLNNSTITKNIDDNLPEGNISYADIEADNKKHQQNFENLKENTSLFFEVTGDDLLRYKLENIPTLLDPLFMQIGVIGVVGTSDIGKSTLLRQFAICVSAGKREFLGWNINSKYQSAIYVSSEDDEYSIKYLLNKQNKELQLNEKDLQRLRYIFYTDNLLENLEITLNKKRADVIIIDAFSDIFPGNINHTNEVRIFLNKFSYLAKKYECLIIFIHHTGKKTEYSEPSKNHILGSQGFEAKMRLIIELRFDYDNPDLRHLCILKGNYLSREYKSQSYVLNFNENMIFSNINERVNLYSLAKPNENKNMKLKELSESVFSNTPILNKEAVEQIKNIDEIKERQAQERIKDLLEFKYIKNIGENNKPKYIINEE